MKKPTLTEIRKSVEADGGSYKKLKMLLNGQQAYEVNGLTMTRDDMIARYMVGTLPLANREM